MEHTPQQPLEIWAIVELFGHQRIAGRVSEQQIAGANMVRIDVPEVPECPAWTRFLNPSAIYAINPVTEEVAKSYAVNIDAKPVQTWDAREVLRRVDQAKQGKLALGHDNTAGEHGMSGGRREEELDFREEDQ